MARREMTPPLTSFWPPPRRMTSVPQNLRLRLEPPYGVLQAARFVPENSGGLFIRGLQFFVSKARDTGIHGEGTQVDIHCYLRPTDEITDVVDTLRPHPLHGAQGGTTARETEPLMEIVPGIDTPGHQQRGIA